MESVRLTVQIRDHDNKVRLTEHHDVPVSRVKAKAAEVAGRLAHYVHEQAGEES